MYTFNVRKEGFTEPAISHAISKGFKHHYFINTVNQLDDGRLSICFAAYRPERKKWTEDLAYFGADDKPLIKALFDYAMKRAIITTIPPMVTQYLEYPFQEADISSRIEEVSQYLTADFNWPMNTTFNFIHKRWIENDLGHHAPKVVAAMHVKRCGAIAESVKAEFQAKHSAMSVAGRNAYADNWN